MKLRLCIIILAIICLFTGCFSGSLYRMKWEADAILCYSNNRENFRQWGDEALALLHEQNLRKTTIYASEGDLVYLLATDSKVSSKSLAEALNGIVKVIIVEEEGVDFLLNSDGFVSSSSYSGLFYCPEDDIQSFPGCIVGLDYTYEDDLIIGESEESDNTVYVKRIDECFFYYYLTF